MHAKAEENLLRKFLGLLNNTTTETNFLSQDGFFERIENLSTDICKIKGQWISHRECSFLLYVYTSDLVESISSNQNSTTPIAQHVNINAHAQHMLSIIKSIPREEVIYYPLPAINKDIDIHITFENGCEIVKIDEAAVQTQTGLLQLLSPNSAPRQNYYLVVRINGYLGNLSFGPGHTQAQSKLKQILERGFSYGFFETSWGGMFRKGESKQRVHSWWAESDSLKSTADGEPQKQRSDLPLDLSHYLQRINFNVAEGISSNNSLEENNAAARGFVDAVNGINSATGTIGDRIRSASEWLCNSYMAEEIPMRILQACIGLESIYGEDSKGEGGLTESLSDRCAYSIGTSHASRSGIKKQFKELYTLRSKIVHGVIHTFSEADFEYIEIGRKLLKTSISKEVWLSRQP